jgi:two-component system, NarL family, nitrate/nitrite response regulator NarL
VQTAARTLLADDHAPSRAGVRSLLELNGFSVCAEADDADGAVDAAVRERPDLCVLDVNMPGGGIAAAAEISSRVSATAIVMLTVSSDRDDVAAALGAGAGGYVLKGTDPEHLLTALRRALAGELAVPAALTRKP